VSCGFPQILFGEHIHGNVESGECSGGLKDLIKGVCWRVFRVKELREKFLEGKGVPSEEDGYKKWISQLDTSGEMINGCRLMLNVWRERQ